MPIPQTITVELTRPIQFAEFQLGKIGCGITAGLKPGEKFADAAAALHRAADAFLLSIEEAERAKFAERKATFNADLDS
jgi:hypothetical protein